MPTVNILIVVGLIILNGLFALSEMAVVSSRRARLQDMAANGTRGARAALQLVDDPGRFLSTIQIGITLVGILAGAFSGATLAAPLAQWLERLGMSGGHVYSLSFGIVVALTTYLTLIVGELVPKRIALHRPEHVASLVAKPMHWLSRLCRPLVALLDLST
ncbi:MAG TPA: CNNM domain-containing protein, partial [Salinisphaeraceae bacterium]|nr:CNNM domain-containing protein [Salinisphaeraceae bacterium]